MTTLFFAILGVTVAALTGIIKVRPGLIHMVLMSVLVLCTIGFVITSYQILRSTAETTVTCFKDLAKPDPIPEEDELNVSIADE